MTLGELIARLEAADPRQVVPHGFTRPHSYRGYYHELAFEPAENITVAEMLTAAKAALGATFTGYKGGEYRMSEYTDVWLARYGECGEAIGPMLLDYMLATPPHPTAPARGERCATDVMGLRCLHPAGHAGNHVGRCDSCGTTSSDGTPGIHKRDCEWVAALRSTPTGAGEAVDLDAIEARLRAIVRKLRYPPHVVSVDDERVLESVAAALRAAREEAARLGREKIDDSDTIRELRAEAERLRAEMACWEEEATQGRVVLAHHAERARTAESTLAARDAELAGVREAVDGLPQSVWALAEAAWRWEAAAKADARGWAAGSGTAAAAHDRERNAFRHILAGVPLSDMAGAFLALRTINAARSSAGKEGK